jgi:hypothetical protein
MQEEPGQVPQGTQDARDEASDQGTMKPLQPGQGEAAPPRLLEQRTPKNHYQDEGPEVCDTGRNGRDIERRQGTRSEERT